ncbi:MAG: aerobic-type carbon monoxide dehydrogenase, middle subunit CoxM/CutM-like protein [Bacteroidetes bacterium]|nr:aerobic-type carbon monoxide dehydrogenase, middle subunit CoxM/CutM-like protein [Bacteroidota bacterium]
MMRLPSFDVAMPMTMPELLENLRPNGHSAKIMAGGTDLLVNMKQGFHVSRRLVWPGRVEELRRISVQSGGEISICAMATLSDVASSDVVKSSYPSLSKAVLSIATPAIRNRATIGGNLCLDTRCYFYNESEFWRGSLGGCLKLNIPAHDDGDVCHAAPGNAVCSAVSSSDSAPILLALDASVEIQSGLGKRIVPLSEFYSNDGMKFLNLTPGELLTRIILPAPRRGLRSAHNKIRSRQSVDFPLANVGIAGVVEEGRVFTHLKIYVGAIQSAPVRITSAEALLEGHEATSLLIKQAAEEAASCVKPVPNIGGTVGYRKRMVAVLVKRTLGEILEVSREMTL